MRINLKDNSVSSKSYAPLEIGPLAQIADKPIAQLCKDYDSLLVFPYSLDESSDRIGDTTILSLAHDSDLMHYRITTGNVMGFIGVGELQLNIQSRFDNNSKNYFLHYMLQRVMSLNLFDLNHNNEQEDVFDFMMFLFPFYLKSALRQGLYREYKSNKNNDANIKGHIDTARHLQLNIPFGGKVAYTKRVHCQDNNVTQLIRHTIEFMRTKTYGRAVLSMDNDTMENLKIITTNTPSYSKHDRNNIIQKNLRIKSHPYYTLYRDLQVLCLQILRMDEIKFGEDEQEICGILFDGAWLWEEYLNTILKAKGFTHPENKIKKNAIYLFNDITKEGKMRKSGLRYPDFYKENFVLDAKYKRLSSYSKVSQVDRNDIHQIISYMKALNAERGGFIAPLEDKQISVPTSRLTNSNASISIFGLTISKTTSSYHDFCEEMRKNEELFIQSLLLSQ